MKILVIGAGAMGSIYGGHLSLYNEVYMIDKNSSLIHQINDNGLKIYENGHDNIYRPTAIESTKDIGTVDLVILFVKSLFSKNALEENRNVISEDTYVLTLQNGAGHEELIEEFVPKNRIIIGTTEDNGAVLDLGYVKRGGVGNTNLGMLVADKQNMLDKCKETFDTCGFNCKLYDNIMQLIWDKLFTNVSLSAVTGILQVPIGYIAANEYAWSMTKQLIHEAITVASALNLKFDEDEIVERVRQTSLKSPDGLTSIYMDLMKSCRTEVDTISGSVVRAAKRVSVPVPTHEFVVNFVHAMEEKKQM
jgi:2-dehydropantoate 2-reductase